MQNRHSRPEDHNRMVIFFFLAAIIMILSYVFITKPAMDRAKENAGVKTETPAVAQTAAEEIVKPVEEVLAQKNRIAISGKHVQGSLSTTGVRFDDIELKDYYQTLEKKDLVRLLSPSDTRKAQFVEIGLIPQDAKIAAPDSKTVWTIKSGDQLTQETPVVMEWNNGSGITFRRTISIDDYYVVTVNQEIVNGSANNVTFYPYALVSQTHHIPVKGDPKPAFEDQPSGVQHIGPIGYLGEDLHEEDYKDVREEEEMNYKNVNGWLGITSKYWLVTLLPHKADTFDARFAHQTGPMKQDIYQADLRQESVTIEPNASQKTEMRFFAGAKKLSVLTDYEEKMDVEKLDLSLDFGILYILTKPLYHLLTFLGNFFHDTFGLTVSFGIALLTLTVLLRLLTFPLQNKAYRSMNKMKDLGPKMHALKEKYGDDKAKFQQEVMGLYKREKINPASGCLPILLQIPIFFSLYKVLYITLDMRHAPFWGWIHDLSAPDPTTVFNLFGLLEFSPPTFLMIGAWPILYGLTMWIQQELNPKPEDDMQKQIFAMLPWVFTFVFAQFPAGLVIYYTWSNLLGIVQQYSVRKLNPHIPVPERKKKKKNVKANG